MQNPGELNWFGSMGKRAIALLMALGVSVAAAGPLDTLQPGQWYQAPNSNLSALDPCPARNCGYSGVEGHTAVMDSWSGGAYDTKRDRMIVWGGGHGAYGGNEVYVFDVNTLTWSRATEPSAISSSDIAPTNTTSRYFDGRPSARHTYSYIEYVPTVDRFYSFGVSATYGQPCCGFYNVDALDFGNASTPWSPRNNFVGAGETTGAKAVYDPVTGSVWYHTAMNGNLQKYDPVSDTWTNYPNTFLWYYSTPAIDPNNHLLVMVGNNYEGPNPGIFVWDLNNPGAGSYSPKVSGDTTIQASTAPGFAYDTVSKKFVGWDGGAAVYTLTVPTDPKNGTWVWTKINPASSNTVTPTASEARGTYGRFRYIPSKNAFIVVNRTTENVYFYKLTNGTSSTPVPTVTLSASATSIAYNASSVLTWSSTNATSCTASGGWSGVLAASGSQTLSNLTSTGTYTLVCSGGGGSASQAVTITVAPSSTPAPTVTLSASPTSVASGGTSALSWSTTNATTCTASGAWLGSKGTSGLETSAALTVTSSFTLSCTGAGGSANQSVTVTVNGSTPAPTVTLSASPSSVLSGASSTLTWSSTNANSCTASGAWSGAKVTSGSETQSNLTSTGTYTLTCAGAGGSASQSVVITVGSSIAPTGIVTIKMSDTGGSAQTNTPITFGQYFKAGDVPSGYTVKGALADGTAVTLQVDKKAMHADGSLKHAVVTAVLPSLAANGSQLLTLSTQADGATPAPLSLSALLATAFDAQISLNVGGTVYSASAKSLLQSATPKVWLSGPQVTEWIVSGPVKTSANVAHPHLTAYFHVRAYAGLNRVRVDASVENGWTFRSGSDSFTYAATVTVGGTTIYTNPTLLHYHHTRWHQVGWWGSAPQVYAQTDTQYLRDTQAVPNYVKLTLKDSVYSGYAQTIVPMNNANLRINWGQTGYDPTIGLLPEWDAAYIIGGDLRAYNAVLANASAGGSYSYHYRDENTGLPPSIDTYPLLSEAEPANAGLAVGAGGNQYSHEPGTDPNAHQPMIGYLAYLLTGDYYYMEELQFLANYDMIWQWCPHRTYKKDCSDGIVGYQNRGQAWGIRTLGHAAALTPDSHPLKTYFVTKTNNNIAEKTDRWASPSANNLGGIQDYDWISGYGTPKYSPWENDFFVSVFGRLVELGFSNAVTMRNWLAQWPVGRMGGNNNDNGYCWYYATQYSFMGGIVQADGSANNGLYDTNFLQLYKRNFPTESALPCPASGGIMTNNAYPAEATGYYSNMQPSMAIAVDAGVASQALWNRFTTAGMPDYTIAPVWAVVPRPSSSAQPAPSVSLSASPTSIAPNGSSTLSWSSVNATSCTASGGGGFSGSVALGGTQTITSIASTTTFTLSCSGAGGSASQSVIVTVVPAPTVTLTANPSSIAYNGSSTLTWSSTNATSCSATGAWTGAKVTSGSEALSALTTTGTYTLNCTGTGGSANKSATIIVAAPLPTVTISASPASVAYNGSSTLTWSSTNITSCTASGAWSGTKAVSGTQSLTALTTTGTYTLTCSGVVQSATVTVAAPPVPTVTISASPASIAYNGSTTLTWSSTDATSCSASNAWTGNKSTSGSQTINALTASGTFGLTCSGAGGNASANASVTVAAPPTNVPMVTFSATPATVNSGGGTKLDWVTANATSCTASASPANTNWSGSKGTNTSTQIISNLTVTTTFTLTCTGSGGTTPQSVTVMIAPASMPTVTLSASPTSVAYQGMTTVTWSSTNATACTAAGSWSGSKAVSGSFNSGALTANATYTLTCTGASDSTSQTVNVAVGTPAPILQLQVDMLSVPFDGSAKLSWTASYADSCTASNAWSGNKMTSGSETTPSLQSDSTYTLTCTGSGLTVIQSVTISVQAQNSPANPPPTSGGNTSDVANTTSITSSKVGGGAVDILMLLSMLSLIAVQQLARRRMLKTRLATCVTDVTQPAASGARDRPAGLL